MSYLLSYRCHTLGVDLESVSVLPILSGCLEHKYLPANVPSTTTTFDMSSSEHLTSLAVAPHAVIPCCRTRFYGPRAAHPDWQAARPRANLERAICSTGLYGTRPRCYTLVVVALRHTSCCGRVVILWCMENDSFVTALFMVKPTVLVWP